LKEFEPEIEKMILIPSEGGVFEVEANGALLFSKKKSGRHAAPGEVKALVRSYLEER
jgi:selenoprotein W-related protein